MKEARSLVSLETASRHRRRRTSSRRYPAPTPTQSRNLAPNQRVPNPSSIPAHPRSFTRIKLLERRLEPLTIGLLLRVQLGTRLPIRPFLNPQQDRHRRPTRPLISLPPILNAEEPKNSPTELEVERRSGLDEVNEHRAVGEVYAEVVLRDVRALQCRCSVLLKDDSLLLPLGAEDGFGRRSEVCRNGTDLRAQGAQLAP